MTDTRFKSGISAAKTYYAENAAFFDNVPDPRDAIEDFFSTVRVRGKPYLKTAAGRKIFSVGAGRYSAEDAITQSLAWIFRQARTRKWSDVDWYEVERLESMLSEGYEPDEDPNRPQSAGPTWRPFSAVTDETIGMLSESEIPLYYLAKEKRDLEESIIDLKTAFQSAKSCMGEPAKRHVKSRIKEFAGWAEDPKKAPPWACEPDEATGGMFCRYPRVTGEVRRLQAACQEGDYAPGWVNKYLGESGFPDPLSAGEIEMLPIEAFEGDIVEERCTLKEAARLMGRRSAAARKAKRVKRNEPSENDPEFWGE